MTNSGKVSQDEVSENQVSRSLVAKTQQPDAEKLNIKILNCQFLVKGHQANFCEARSKRVYIS